MARAWLRRYVGYRRPIDTRGIVMQAMLGFFGSPGPYELLIVGIIALLLFGKRLPEVARSLGRGIVEFKKGVQGIEDEIDTATYNPRPAASRPLPPEERDDVSAPRFEPPAAAPQEEANPVHQDQV